ncbi:MAG TPA: PHP-associated domain-containing protein [Anaerolineales bacterium]|nr:PHP-associated domain-containing protein [Anaerolineales bacterium]
MTISLEFHCHTRVSKDSLTRPADLVFAARRKGIDRVIITDHNSIAGAREARTIDPELIIIGEEIMTSKGEILAAFVQEHIPADLTPQETIRRLKEQGAFISVSHPFDQLRKGGWKENDLLEILPFVDAIEIYNSRCMFPRFNNRASEFAKQHNVAGTVGSDAHAAFELGRSLLYVDQFTSPQELRQVIRGAKMKLKRSPWWVHFISRYASMRRNSKS